MSRILLTGATGFLGSHLLGAFLEDGHSITALKRSTSDTWRIQSLLGKCEVANIDQINSNELLARNDYDAVFHTVCDYGRQGHSAHEISQTNLIFGLELLEAAANNGVKCFINTDSLLPRDLNAYALSKHQFVDWLKFYSNQIQVINLKLEHMYGPKDDPSKLVNWLIKQFQTNVKRIPLTNGHQRRDFVYITDVVDAFKATFNAVAELPNYSEFAVGSGKLTSVRDFVQALAEAYRKIEPACTTELGFGDIAVRKGELMEVSVDLTALQSLGCFSKVPLSQGLKMLLEESK